MGTLELDQGIMTAVTIVTIAISVALALLILYSVIWRAVRRGLREFHYPAPVHAPRSARRVSVKVPNYPPSEWV